MYEYENDILLVSIRGQGVGDRIEIILHPFIMLKWVRVVEKKPSTFFRMVKRFFQSPSPSPQYKYTYIVVDEKGLRLVDIAGSPEKAWSKLSDGRTIIQLRCL